MNQNEEELHKRIKGLSDVILHACSTEPYTVIFSSFLTTLHQIGKNFSEDELSFALDEMKKEILNARREEGII